MTSRLYIDSDDFEKVEAAIKRFGEGAEDVITETLHDSGESIYQDINPLIHPSDRRFKGHRSSATTSSWPHYGIDKPLEVSVGTKSKFHYLYFPDDGSNTDRHRGNQQFFKRGGDIAAPRIVSQCLDALASKWKE